MVVGHKFSNGTSHPAGHATILNRNNFIEFPENIMKQLLVQRFYKPHVVMCRMDTFGIEFQTGFNNFIPDMSNG